MALSFSLAQLRVGVIATSARCYIRRSSRAGQRRVDRSACVEKGRTFRRTIRANLSYGYMLILDGKVIARFRSGRYCR